MSKKAKRPNPTSRNERRKAIAAKHGPQRDWFDAGLDNEFNATLARLAEDDAKCR